MARIKLQTLLLAAMLSLGGATVGYTKQADTTRTGTKADESKLVEHGHYVNRVRDRIHSPAHTVSGKAAAGATAKCGDGSYSFSTSHRGTCSHHGGVGNWL